MTKSELKAKIRKIISESGLDIQFKPHYWIIQNLEKDLIKLFININQNQTQNDKTKN